MTQFICTTSKAEQVAAYLDKAYGPFGDFYAEGKKVTCSHVIGNHSDVEEIQAAAQGYFDGLNDSAELLAALENLEAAASTLDGHYPLIAEMCSDARAAIAKAKGE